MNSLKNFSSLPRCDVVWMLIYTTSQIFPPTKHGHRLNLFTTPVTLGKVAERQHTIMEDGRSFPKTWSPS